MKRDLDSLALQALIWQAIVDRANGRTPNSIQPTVTLSPAKPKRKDYLKGLDEQPERGMEVRQILERLMNKNAADNRPSDADLRRMYDVVQADARLTSKLEGLGFGRSGDAYRTAALKFRLMSLMNVLRDGKNIRNGIVHKPGYIPSEQSTARALLEYSRAAEELQEYLNRKRNPAC